MAENKKTVYVSDSVIEITPHPEVGFQWKVGKLTGTAFTQEDAEQAAKLELKISKKIKRK